LSVTGNARPRVITAHTFLEDGTGRDVADDVYRELQEKRMTKPDPNLTLLKAIQTRTNNQNREIRSLREQRDRLQSLVLDLQDRIAALETREQKK
jgi:polyhydroxyalkanoate synthesis regulator phasin